MIANEIEELRRQYTDKHVVVDAGRPELARFAGLVGQVKTVNMNGCALVEFAGPSPGWFDIDPEFLQIVEGGQGLGANDARPVNGPAK